MARIEDLPADQQAVLRLLLTQERSYDEIARSLRMAPAGVRDRAHEALASLGPGDAPVDAAARAQITDYLLGQQDEDEARRTRERLSSSAGARGWARSVCGELAPMAQAPLPEIPGGDGGANAAVFDEDAGAADERRARRRGAGEGALEAPASRRGGRILLTALGVLVALAAGFFIGRATKGDDEPQRASDAAAAGRVVGQANLTPPKDAPDRNAVGVAQFVERDGQQLINVLAEGLPRAPAGSGYGVWLTGPGRPARWLGYFQAVTTSGQVGAQSRLDVDPGEYRAVEIARQRGREPKKPGTVYLSGRIQLGANGRGADGG